LGTGDQPQPATRARREAHAWCRHLMLSQTVRPGGGQKRARFPEGRSRQAKANPSAYCQGKQEDDCSNEHALEALHARNPERSERKARFVDDGLLTRNATGTGGSTLGIDGKRAATAPFAPLAVLPLIRRWTSSRRTLKSQPSETETTTPPRPTQLRYHRPGRG